MLGMSVSGLLETKSNLLNRNACAMRMPVSVILSGIFENSICPSVFMNSLYKICILRCW